jgi:hypothetical protein
VPPISPLVQPAEPDIHPGLSPAQFEKRRAETRAAWEKFNRGKPFPGEMFDDIWRGMDRAERARNPGAWVLEPLTLHDGQKIYCVFSPDRTRADLYNKDGNKTATWMDR